MKVIGIVGSRRRNSTEDFDLVWKVVKKRYEEGDEFVSGGCPTGGDAFCERIARTLGASIKIHHAAWDRHGRGAGFIRNSYIADDATILIALVAADRKGGTEDTITKFCKRIKLNELAAVLSRRLIKL